MYIPRRRRFCTHAAADGLGGLCSEHAAAAARERAEQDAPPSRTPPAAEAEDGCPPSPSASPSPADPAWVKPGWTLKRNIRRRMKRMTNPLAAQFAAPPPPPDWASVFADPSLPSLLDVGCAKGRFLLDLSADAAFAERHGTHNFAGVEIFAPLAAAANAEAARLGRRNLHYVGANANLHFAAVCPPNLARVAVQFPDPWRDDNAVKRVLTPAFAGQIAEALRPGGELFLVSDVLAIASEMRAVALATGAFRLHGLHESAASERGWGEERGQGEGEGERAAAGGGEAGGERRRGPPPPEGGWLRVRPYGVPTERDLVCEMHWRPIYRTLLVKK